MQSQLHFQLVKETDVNCHSTNYVNDLYGRVTKRTINGKHETIYTYDKNGNRIASEKNSEKLDYIYDTENRLLAIKDKKGLLMAALYDGDDNRVFTASRKEGKNTYQLFQRKPKDTKSGRKSPYTAPSGEENSLFWYGFSQNVLQALSALPQTIGSIWHSIFDDVSTAYHQKVAKDRASKEGIVVNPPELGNLPGQGEVTYASQVQDVLIPYTTREDTYNYYEERNYVNDVNREHTEVLETYDHDGKARETYSYGKGRASYLNNQTGDSYNYLTNQSGSVTGLTKDGQAVASSSYHLYGARKASTDTTGNPFAYNGEARDDTGLDYLRARYYDSQGGTFLTEDSYPGEDTDPLSQNRYSYVQNNPVNYTDPSGHFWNSIKKGWNYVKKTASNAWNDVKKVASNTWNTVKRVASKAWNATKSAFNHATNWISTQYNRAVNWGSRQWNKVQTAYNSTVDYVQTKYQQTVAQIEAKRQQVVRSAYALATGLSSSPTIREGLNLYRNWNTALENTLKHVCNPKTIGASDKGETKVPSVADFRKYEDAARHGLRLDQKERIDRMTLEEYLQAPPMTPEENAYASNVKFAKFNQENKAKLPTIAAELIGWNNGERLVTGKDPLTGEDANRWAAGAELAVDIASNVYPIAKASKLRKLEKALDAVDAVNDASKVAKAADKANDASKATISKIPEITINFTRNSKHDATEFSRQLANQQNGMNRLTVADYINNRGSYLANGRSSAGNAAQKAAREKALADKYRELRQSGLGRSEAKSEADRWIKTQAALHDPDQIAGGFPKNVTGVGDFGINSSIGAQWKDKIATVDNVVDEIVRTTPYEDLNKFYLNIKLQY